MSQLEAVLGGESDEEEEEEVEQEWTPSFQGILSRRRAKCSCDNPLSGTY